MEPLEALKLFLDKRVRFSAENAEHYPDSLSRQYWDGKRNAFQDVIDFVRELELQGAAKS